MKKFVVHRLFWNFEKEEKWLNQMASKGMNFIDYAFARYLFEQGTPGEFIYRIELLENLPDHPESLKYIEFMESVGVEHVGKWMRWIYFRKKASGGPFEIFSDYNSRIIHYKRISSLFCVAGVLNLFAFLLNTFNVITLDTKVDSRYFTYILPLIFINGLLAGGFTWLFIKYRRKISRLKKEKQLYG